MRHFLTILDCHPWTRSLPLPVLTVSKCGLILRAELLIGVVLIFSFEVFAQAENIPPTASKPVSDRPLTSEERAELLKIIRNLQERVDKLEAAQAATKGAAITTTPTPDAVATRPTPLVEPPVATTTPEPAAAAPKAKDDDDDDDDKDWTYGKYTPNFGFKVVNTEYGDLNISVYTYARYLNQLGLNSNYQDAFGNTKNVQERQDFQLQKVQVKLLGWLFDPKFRYFIYTWTSNATQGQGAQVVVARDRLAAARVRGDHGIDEALVLPSGTLRRAYGVGVVTDESGIPVAGVLPRVEPVSGGGSFDGLQVYSNAPFAYGLNLRLGPLAGANVFRVQAGEVTRELTVIGQ